MGSLLCEGGEALVAERGPTLKMRDKIVKDVQYNCYS